MGGQALSVPTDIANSADVERLFVAAMEAFGRVDILVNNAGITRDKSFGAHERRRLGCRTRYQS